jgi:hypothetical protein
MHGRSRRLTLSGYWAAASGPPAHSRNTACRSGSSGFTASLMVQSNVYTVHCGTKDMMKTEASYKRYDREVDGDITHNASACLLSQGFGKPKASKSCQRCALLAAGGLHACGEGRPHAGVGEDGCLKGEIVVGAQAYHATPGVRSSQQRHAQPLGAIDVVAAAWGRGAGQASVFRGAPGADGWKQRGLSERAPQGLQF